MYKILKGLIYAALGLAVLAVAAALVAPRFIDWKSYSVEIEAEASRLTGHKVILGGALDLDLLPSPSLTAENVTVAGAPGTAPLARIGRLDIKVALLPLLAGRVEATSVVLVEPRITIAKGNWKATPVAGPTGGAKPAAGGTDGDLSFSLKDVRLRDGTLSIARKGAPPAIARMINMRLSAETLQGPFRGAGTLTVDDIPLRLEFSAGRPDADGAIPLKVALLPPGETRGRIWLQGDLVRPGPEAKFAGKLRIEAKSSRAPAAALLAVLGVPLPDKAMAGPMTGEATLTASASGFRIVGLVLDLAGTSMKADVDMRFGDEGARRPSAKITAAVSRVDLDALIGAYAAMEGPGGGAESGAGGGGTGSGSAGPSAGYQGIKIGNSIDVDLKLNVDALVLNRSVIRGVAGDARLVDGQVSIRRLTALLPGAAKIEIAGRMREDGGFTKFQGKIDAEAGNLRGMLDWLAIDVAGIPADRLRKSSFSANLTVASDEVTLRDIRAAVDLTAFTGKAGVMLTARPKVEVALDVGALDLDAYMPRGVPVPALPAGSKPPPKPASQGEDSGTVPAIDWHKLAAGADIGFRVSTAALTAQGRALGPMSLTYESGKDGAKLRDLTLADVGGTSVKISGEKMLAGGRTAIEAKVEIADLGKLAAFAGAVSEGLPQGAVSTTLRLSQESADGDWALSLTSEHAEGVATVTGRGKITEAHGRRRIAADLAASEIDAALLFALLSNRGGPDAMPGKAPSGENKGSDTSGGTSAGTSGGTAPKPASWSKSAIDLTMLHAVDLVLKIKASTLKAGDLRIDAPRLVVNLDRGQLQITDVAGKLYGGVLTGKLALDARAIPKASVALAINGVDLTRAIGAVRFREKEIVGLAAGRADVTLRLAGEGASMAALMSSLSGSASLKAYEGIVKGFDLALANRQISGRQGNFGILGLISVAMTRGSTKFKALSAAAAIKAGRITVTKGALDAEGGNGALAGTIDLGARAIDLKSEFRFDSIPKAPPLDMRVLGAFGATRSVIDVKALTAWLRANPPGGN